MAQALSAQNARVKYARDLLTKKGRDEHRAFAFEGATLLLEALRSGMTPDALFVTSEAREKHAAVRRLEREGVPTYVVNARAFETISDVETPTGILAVASIRSVDAAEIAGRAGTLLVLAGISDPGNAGTLLRSAEAFGCAGVIFSGGVDPHHPKVVRSAMGSAFRVPVASAAPGAASAAIRAASRAIVGLAAGGGRFGGFQEPSRLALVVGHERRGLGPWGPLCDRLAAIPMQGSVESLNAAVAASLALYEATQPQVG